MKYTTDSIREKWIRFWKSKHHTIIDSASVVPDNDPTALFINSGMHPLVPYLIGETHPQGVRLANSQKCIRTIDIDEVGDATHLTFFEMLGNWSLGDFFKHEQIRWSYEFLTDVLEIPIEKLAVSVFAGDQDAPRDTESADIWKHVGVNTERIAYLPKSENWWAKGEFGPCGPDTEIFYWADESPAPKNFQENWEDPRWIEIWNNVFMQFNKQEDGKLVELPAKNIDTGMGLERTVAILNNKKSVYQTDAFEDIIQKIAKISGITAITEDILAHTPEHNSARIIADHIRSAVVLLSDGVIPMNIDQGYILRRLIRRAIRHGRNLNMGTSFCADIAESAIKKLGTHYHNIDKNHDNILQSLSTEETLFQKTLETGEKKFEKILENTAGKVINGEIAFDLYQTYGFPLEITQELAMEKGYSVDEKKFCEKFEEHQQKSQSASGQKFAGGLSGEDVEAEAKLHTATHLLHAALRKVLGEEVQQKGSNITPDRLRFDFNYKEKMTDIQKEKVEKYVNDAIKTNIEIIWSEMTLDEARKKGAIGLFESKYGDTVKVYNIGGFSTEVCGGPHAKNTGTLGHFRITKEQSAAQGIRRIKAVLEGSS